MLKIWRKNVRVLVELGLLNNPILTLKNQGALLSSFFYAFYPQKINYFEENIFYCLNIDWPNFVQEGLCVLFGKH